jgi:hypothetical protein
MTTDADNFATHLLCGILTVVREERQERAHLEERLLAAEIELRVRDALPARVAARVASAARVAAAERARQEEVANLKAAFERECRAHHETRAKARIAHTALKRT